MCDKMVVVAVQVKGASWPGEAVERLERVHKAHTNSLALYMSLPIGDTPIVGNFQSCTVFC